MEFSNSDNFFFNLFGCGLAFNLFRFPRTMPDACQFFGVVSLESFVRSPVRDAEISYCEQGVLQCE